MATGAMGELPPETSGDQIHVLPVGFSQVGYFPETPALPPPYSAGGMAKVGGDGVTPLVQAEAPSQAGGAGGTSGSDFGQLRDESGAGSAAPDQVAVAVPVDVGGDKLSSITDGDIRAGAAPTKYDVGLTSKHLVLGFVNVVAIVMAGIFFFLPPDRDFSFGAAPEFWDFPRPLIAPFFFLWLIFYYVFACYCTESARFLRNRQDLYAAQAHIADIKATRPEVLMRCECYHYETRTESYTDSRGNRRTRSRRVKVTTFNGREPFPVTSVADATGELHGLERYVLTMVKYEKARSWADAYTEAAFNAMFDAFKAAHRNRDTHFHAWEELAIPGWKGEVLVSGAGSAACVDRRLQMLLTLLLLAWPYALYVEWKSARTKLCFVKVISLQPGTAQVPIAPTSG